MTEILKMAHERIFSAEIFGEGMARKLDGLWLAQQLGAHDDYAPHRVQTRPCGHSLYEAEMLLQMHAASPAPFFACVARFSDLRALFLNGDDQAPLDYARAKQVIDDLYFAFFAWLATQQRR